ncbi:MAG TPA: TonB-dependent receptor, partial [Myxococcota bacterium]
ISVGSGTSAFGGDNGVTSFGLRDDLTFKASDAFSLRMGFDGFGESTQSAIAAPIVAIDVNAFPSLNGGGFGAAQSVLTSSSSESVNQNELRLAPALYLEGQIEPFHGFKIIPGIRGELTHVELDPVVKADGTSEQGATINEWTLDPRFTVRWELLPWTTVKAAFGVYHESPTNAQLSPTSGNPALDQPRALQVIGGVEQRLTDLISIDLQVYDTERDQLVRTLSSTGFGFGGGGGGGGGAGAGLAARAPGGAAGALASGTSNAADRSDNGGTGRTIGLDLLVRHDISKYFYGWIAYTLSQTVVDTDAKKNRLVLSQNDQTHILTVVAQTNLPWELSLGARFRLVSGDPTSVPAGSLHDLDSGSYQTQQSDDTETRLPTFQELDVRLDRKWIFDAFAVTTYLDVLNVYNAQNAEGVLTDYRARQQQAIPSLPILPVIGVQGEF